MLLAPSSAPADPPLPPRVDDRLTFRADRFEGDAALGDVTLEGGVEIAYDRYRLRGRRLQLRVERGAIVFAGDARAALCPCPDPPITFLAAGGRFEPPGDLVLRFPRLAVAGVPVVALPWLWLRAPDRVGILPPLVTVRGADGLLLGSGVHLPWRGSEGEVEAVDLLAGGYVKGGAEIGARLVTAGSDASVIADLVRGTRVALDSPRRVRPRGPCGARQRRRGVDDGRRPRRPRALRHRGSRLPPRCPSTPPPPRPRCAPRRDRRAQSSPAAPSRARSAAKAPSLPARARRWRWAGQSAPSDRGAPTPWASCSATATPGPRSPALTLGRASAGAEIDARPGPFALRVAVRARAQFAGDEASSESAAAARLDLELPFARAFDAGTAASPMGLRPAEPGSAPYPAEAPLVHWIIPSLSIRGALAEQRGPFFVPLGGVVPPASWIAAAGLSTAIGRYAGPALRLDVRAGAIGGAQAAQGSFHARLGVDALLAAAAIEAAAMGDRAGEVGSSADPRGMGQSPAPPGGAPSWTRGFALLGRVRIGRCLRPVAAPRRGCAGGSGRRPGSRPGYRRLGCAPGR